MSPPTPECYLRTFDPGTDLPAVETFITNTLPERYQTATLLDIQRLWPQGFLLCLQDTPTGSQLVGLIAGIFSTPKTLRILLLAIDRTFRRQQLGQHLLERLVARAHEGGAREVVLEVKVNSPAVDFYKAQGFQVRRLLPLFYQDCSDALLMGRRL